MNEKRNTGTAAEGRLAFCSDEEIVAGPAFGFGGRGIGEAEEAAMREALDAVADEDDFFFANVDFAAAAGRTANDGTDAVEERTPARKRAPLGFFDMTADERPLPSIGVVVAKNASSRDAVLVVRNEEGETVARKWAVGETIALRDGRIGDRAPVPPKGKTRAYVPYVYRVSVGYQKDDGSARIRTRLDAGAAEFDMTAVDAADFPLAFVAEETDAGAPRAIGRTKRREIRAWNGKFWSRSSSWGDPDERTTVEDLERRARASFMTRCLEVADSRCEADAAEIAKEARLANAKIETLDACDKRSRIMVAAKRFVGRPSAITCERAVWREVGEPRYVAKTTENGETRLELTVDLRPASRGVDEEFPATMTKDEVVAYAEAKRGRVVWSTDDAVVSVEVVDPKYVTIAAPAP